jgi:hypothetical protein
MEIWITDTAHGRAHLKVAGNSTLDEACAAYKTKWNLPDWDEVTLKRADDAPFWVEEKGEYSATVRYDPDKATDQDAPSKS